MSLSQRLAFTALSLALCSAHAFDLTVEVLNPKLLQGSINAAVFGSAETWLQQPQALGAQRAPVADKTQLVFRGLPAGNYAVSLFHDENGNGQMDRNVIGLPLERYGFSRDARATMGAPTFADAAFELKADTSISITLK